MIKQTATIAMLAIAGVAFSGVTIAQNSTDAAGQQGQLTEHQQKVKQATELLQKLRGKIAALREIHAATLKANPELMERRNALATKVRKAMEAAGYDIEAGRQRVKEMKKKLKSGTVEKPQARAMLQQYAAERHAMAKARAAAMQNPEISKARKELRQDTLAAMKARSDRVEPLLQEIERLAKKVREMKAELGDN